VSGSGSELVDRAISATLKQVSDGHVKAGEDTLAGFRAVTGHWKSGERWVQKPRYTGSSASTGPLQEGRKVRYRPTLSRRQNWTLAALTLLSTGASLLLLVWLITASALTHTVTLARPPVPREIPGWTGTLTGLPPFPAAMLLPGTSSRLDPIAVILVALMVLLESNRVWQTLNLAVFASKARDPIPLRPARPFRVAVLTTIVPGKEPVEMVLGTLRAMKAMHGTFDVWLLDEGNDPAIREACHQIGVKHFSRKGAERYHQPSGAYRTKSKAGNHNAWRDQHGSSYDIVAQMDPDHIPFEDFLDRTLGYFNDPDTAFIVAPMVYGNWEGADYGGPASAGNWIAHGAAQQAFVFQGVVQRGLNGLDSPLLIGTNHLYRVTAWDQIGGYQDSIIEDHFTAMVVYATHNPVTGNRWKGVYTPDIIAVGEAPTSFTDWFNQQKRWAYGMWEVILHHSRHVLPRQKWSQRLSYALLQPYYPSVALNWLLSIALTTTYMTSRVSLHLPLDIWAPLWAGSVLSCLALSFWFRRFNLTPVERREWGMPGMVLMLMTLPVYVVAGASKCAGRKLVYAVTAKGDLASPDGIRTFRSHLLWAAWSAVVLGLSIAGVVSSWPGLLVWAAITGAISISPVAVHYLHRLLRRSGTPAVEAPPVLPAVEQPRRLELEGSGEWPR